MKRIVMLTLLTGLSTQLFCAYDPTMGTTTESMVIRNKRPIDLPPRTTGTMTVIPTQQAQDIKAKIQKKLNELRGLTAKTTVYDADQKNQQFHDFLNDLATQYAIAIDKSDRNAPSSDETVIATYEGFGTRMGRPWFIIRWSEEAPLQIIKRPITKPIGPEKKGNNGVRRIGPQTSSTGGY